MVRVTLWPQLLLVVLLLRQLAAVSDQCSELQDGIFRLERDLLSMRELKDMNKLRAGKCEEHLRKQVLILEATSNKFNKTMALNNDLKKQLEVKEEALKIINEKQTKLQTTIDGLTETVEKLLCETTKNVCRSLLDAAESGDVDSVKRLVKCDSNDNCTDDDERRQTPLMYAAEYGHVEVVRLLLEGGANVDRDNANQSTALHYAATYGHLDVCRLLLDWGAKMDRLSKRKYTPLLHAAKWGYLSVVKLLVERGADVSVKGKEGYTALHYAARWGSLSVVKLLVERGADVSMKNKDGQTASDLARWWGKKDMADWLDNVRRG